MLHKDSKKSSSPIRVRWRDKAKNVNSPREPSDRALRAPAEAAMRNATGGVQAWTLDDGGGEKEVEATMDATVIERASVSQPLSRHALRNADPETARLEKHLGEICEILEGAMDDQRVEAVRLYIDATFRRIEAVLESECDPSNPAYGWSTETSIWINWSGTCARQASG